MDVRLVLCECCGSEGRIYRGHSNDPNPRDDGPCPICEGTGSEIVDVEPITVEDLHCSSCGATLPQLFPCQEQECPQSIESYDSAMEWEHGPDLIRER